MSDLTICILSAVEPPLSECLRAVEAQEGGPHPVVRVHDVFPMSAAFNAMVDRCPSRFIVQVDGDVVLEPWAIDRLYSVIRCTPLAYMVWGQLWEEGFGRGGSVRIWRRWPLRVFRFRDRRSVDLDLHQRIRWTGMRRVQVPAGWHFGVHYPRMTPFAKYSKTYSDVCKWRTRGRADLVENLGRNCLDVYSRLGYEQALQADQTELLRSKDAEGLYRKFLVLET